MKQNIIIFLLTVICAILGYMAAEMKAQESEPAKQAAASEFKPIPYKDEPVRLPQSNNSETVEGGYINLPMPPYPRKSVENEEEGTVRIEVIIEPDGTLSTARIIKSSGYGELDMAALKAAKGSNIRPRIINGKPARSRYITPFNFKLSP